MHAVTNKRLATVPDAERALFAIAISAARNAFSAWDAVPFARRKAILARVLNKMDDDADELSALLTAEQRITLAEARWEINLLINEFGPALMQMELPEKGQDAQWRGTGCLATHSHQGTHHPPPPSLRKRDRAPLSRP